MTQKEERRRERRAARFVGIGVTTAVNPTTRNSRNVAHLGEISSNRGVEKLKELEANSEAQQDAEARARGASEAHGGDGDDAFAWRSVRERQGENGQALSECGVSWHP